MFLLFLDILQMNWWQISQAGENGGMQSQGNWGALILVDVYEGKYISVNFTVRTLVSLQFAECNHMGYESPGQIFNVQYQEVSTCIPDIQMLFMQECGARCCCCCCKEWEIVTSNEERQICRQCSQSRSICLCAWCYDVTQRLSGNNLSLDDVDQPKMRWFLCCV